jgi:hypothetical protein
MLIIIAYNRRSESWDALGNAFILNISKIVLIVVLWSYTDIQCCLISTSCQLVIIWFCIYLIWIIVFLILNFNLTWILSYRKSLGRNIKSFLQDSVRLTRWISSTILTIVLWKNWLVYFVAAYQQWFLFICMIWWYYCFLILILPFFYFFIVHCF